MRDLMPLAVALRDVAGGFQEALEWTDTLRARGPEALAGLGLQGDRATVLLGKAKTCGVLSSQGQVDRVRLSELVVLLDALTALPKPPSPAPHVHPLVFTVPKAAEGLVTVQQPLDVLVNDVVARADRTLHIGGPFWNEGGWELLRAVVLPALEHRRVTATFYLHPHESGRADVVNAMLTEARGYGSVQELWWAGSVLSLMHAKFIVADGVTGYFGSANLTSLGLGLHLEMGGGARPLSGGGAARPPGGVEGGQDVHRGASPGLDRTGPTTVAKRAQAAGCPRRSRCGRARLYLKPDPTMPKAVELAGRDVRGRREAVVADERLHVRIVLGHQLGQLAHHALHQGPSPAGRVRRRAQGRR